MSVQRNRMDGPSYRWWWAMVSSPWDLSSSSWVFRLSRWGHTASRIQSSKDLGPKFLITKTIFFVTNIIRYFDKSWRNFGQSLHILEKFDEMWQSDVCNGSNLWNSANKLANMWGNLATCFLIWQMIISTKIELKKMPASADRLSLERKYCRSKTILKMI